MITPDLFPPSIEEMCRLAMERIVVWINRSAGQHARRMREAWSA